MQEFVSLNVWSRIKPISDKSRTKTAAVAYVTSETIVQFGAGDVLVTDASDNAIACGNTSARVLKAAMDRGADLYSCEGLHAKVIVFDAFAMIGSANLSERSERELVEASWITDDPPVVAEARTFVNRLAADNSRSRKIDLERLEHILAIKVIHRSSSAPVDEDVEAVLSRTRNKTGGMWLSDPGLVLMDRDEVRSLGGRPQKSLGQRIWVRKDDLGTERYSARSIPRTNHQILISASVELAKAKRCAATRDEILDLVVTRYRLGKLANAAERKSEQLREDPLGFFREYFNGATEDSSYQGGKLKYHIRATPAREKAFLSRIGNAP